MANTSGPVSAIAGLPGAFSFFNPTSGFQFTIQGSPLVISFRKESGGASGSIQPVWFIGSGHVGRSFVFSRDGWLFMSPISWYAQRGAWDVSPGYEHNKTLYLTRPVTETCWECHSTGPRHITGTVNKFENRPFREAGVGCERCHGPGLLHVQAAARGDDPKVRIVNPSRLTAERRGDVCAQCHLTGAVRINKLKRTISEFRAGEDLSAYVIVFVDKNTATEQPRATGHFEGLSASRCFLGSKGRMWCGTCHSIHSPSLPREKDPWYRARCLTCHAIDDCGEKAPARTARKDNCVACHMPPTSVANVQHAAYTDHRIRKRPTMNPVATGNEIVPFGAGAGPREIALAKAQIGFERHDPALLSEALEILRPLEPSLGADAEALTVLGVLYASAGDEQKARDLYEASLKIDPSQAQTAVNLGAIYADEGRTAEAMALWNQAQQAQPGLDLAYLDKAKLLIAQGKPEEARRELDELLSLSPGHPLALEGLRRLEVTK